MVDHLNLPPEGAPGAPPLRVHVSLRMLVASFILGVSDQLGIDRRHLILWTLLDIIRWMLMFIILDALIAFVPPSFWFLPRKAISRANQCTFSCDMNPMKNFYSVLQDSYSICLIFESSRNLLGRCE